MNRRVGSARRSSALLLAALRRQKCTPSSAGDSESDGFSDCPSDVSAAERTDSVERRGRATGDGVSGRELRSSIDAEAAANR